MDPLHIGQSIGEDVLKIVKGGIADVANAAVDGALKQAPMIDALLNGEAVEIRVQPIRLQLAIAQKGQ